MNDRMSEAVSSLQAAITGLPEPADELPVELCEVWAELARHARTLSVTVKAWNHAAASALTDVDYDRKEGFALGDGTVVHHTQSSSRWFDGPLITGYLSQHMVDPHGELVEAVPVSVLADVLPAYLGRSQWKSTGLKLHVAKERVEACQTVEWGPVTLREGTMR